MKVDVTWVTAGAVGVTAYPDQLRLLTVPPLRGRAAWALVRTRTPPWGDPPEAPDLAGEALAILPLPTTRAERPTATHNAMVKRRIYNSFKAQVVGLGG
jgi:hypothetical protein